MNQLAKTMMPDGARLSAAVVTAVGQGGALTVELGGEVLQARRAESCLLAPEPGDEVLAALMDSGRAYVTAVLERSGDGERRLELDGDAALSAPGGRLRVSARDGVDLRTPGEINLTAAGLNLTAAVGRVMVDNATLAGKVARAVWDQVSLRAGMADSAVDRMLGRFKLRATTVEGLDRQRAGTLQQEVDGVHTNQSEYSVTRARKDVRVDGRQIIMG